MSRRRSAEFGRRAGHRLARPQETGNGAVALSDAGTDLPHSRPATVGCGQRGDVDTLGIEAWIAAMVSGATTVLRAHGVLSGMLADAVKAGLPPTRPRVSKTCRARRPSVMSTCRPMTYTG